MELSKVLAALALLAERAGIRVRFDRFDPQPQGGSRGGGLCTVNGTPTVIVDATASLFDQVAVLAAALEHHNVHALFVPRTLAHKRRPRPTGPTTRPTGKPAKRTS